MTDGDNGLAGFLRAHRARVQPADAGLPGGTGRRVVGLRREEVAVLAGVSADYYARLEQGRERHPSPQVLGALAQALRLEPDSREHLYRLARLLPGVVESGEQVHPALRRLLDSFPFASGYVIDPVFDVLATNAVADALFCPFRHKDNSVRMLFLDPVAREFFGDWEMMARSSVQALRLNAGRFPGHPRIEALVAEVGRASREFRALWRDHSVHGLVRTVKTIRHPQIGRLELTFQTFDVRDAPGQQLLVGTAAEGSAGERALRALGRVRA
ncbi:helix-turn-helix transcriptional regulator [Amycolatopsis sp. NPDC004368]